MKRLYDVTWNEQGAFCHAIVEAKTEGHAIDLVCINNQSNKPKDFIIKAIPKTNKIKHLLKLLSGS